MHQKTNQTIQRIIPISSRFLAALSFTALCILLTCYWNVSSKTISFTYNIQKNNSVALKIDRNWPSKSSIRWDVENEIMDVLTNFTARCKKHVRINGWVDGTYSICIDCELDIQRNNCLAYSGGIQNIWWIEDGLAKLFKCTVRAFDPSMNVDDHVRSSGVFFYNTAIGAIDREPIQPGNTSVNWQVRTLGTIARETGDTRRQIQSNIPLPRGITQPPWFIDYLKLDIESSEYETLTEAILSGVIPDHVKQLVLEFHFTSHNPDDLKRWLNVILALQRVGFAPWRWEPNTVWVNVRPNVPSRMKTECGTVYYINTRYYPEAHISYKDEQSRCQLSSDYKKLPDVLNENSINLYANNV